MDDYLDSFLELNDQLKAVDAGLSTTTMVGRAIAGLNSQFQPTADFLEICAHTLDMISLRTALRAAARKRGRGQAAVANLARGDVGGQSPGPGVRSPRGEMQTWGREATSSSNRNPFEGVACNHCGNKGHIAAFCLLKGKRRADRKGCGVQPQSYAPGFPKEGVPSPKCIAKMPPVSPVSVRVPRRALPSKPTPALSPLQPASAYTGGTNSTLVADAVQEWVLDSGASACMTMERGCIREYCPFQHPKQVHFGNGAVELALGEGKVMLDTGVGKMSLSSVLYVPALATNLISVSSLVKQMHSLHINGGTEQIVITAGGKVVGLAALQEGIYILSQSGVVHFAGAAMGESAAMRWHRQLGHTNFGTLADMQRKGWIPECSVRPAEFLEARDQEPCVPCSRGKMHRISHKLRQTRAAALNFRLHSDVMGPFRVKAVGGYQYVLTLTDEASGFSLVELLKAKSEVKVALPHLVKQFEVQGGAPVRRLRTDNGGEYMSTELISILEGRGIWLETTAAYTPEQNGLAERLNRTLMERARTFLSESALPLSIWGYSVHHANNIRNSVPYGPTGQPPFLYFTGVDPSMHQFHPFGSEVQMHVGDAKRHKLQPKSVGGR